MTKRILQIVAVWALALSAAPGGGLEMRSALAGEVTRGKTISIDVNKAQLVSLPGPASTVFVANPDIADVQVPNRKSFLVFGKQAGSTVVYAFRGRRGDELSDRRRKAARRYRGGDQESRAGWECGCFERARRHHLVGPGCIPARSGRSGEMPAKQFLARRTA